MKPAPSRLYGSRGNALVTVLIISAALLAVASVTMTFSRSDTMVSLNSTRSADAMWAAQAGAEVAKEILRGNFVTPGVTPINDTPVTVGPTPLASDGYTYTSSVRAYPGASATPYVSKFLIESQGDGPDMTQQRIREVVKIARFDADLSPINIHGVGSHTKVGITGGSPVPFFTIDGRNHDLHGDPYQLASQLPARCPALSVPAVSADSNGRGRIEDEINDLRCGLVKEAIDCCDGSCGGGRVCTAGLSWIYGQASMNTAQNSCPQTNDTSPPANNLYPNVPLDSTNLRTDIALAPAFLGPIGPESAPDATTGVTSLIRDLGAVGGANMNALAAQIQTILQAAIDAPATQKQCMPAENTLSTNENSPTFLGTAENPMITVVAKTSHSDARYLMLRDQACGIGATGSASYNLDGGKDVVGYGILIVPRALILDGNNAANKTTFKWRGIIVILDDGDLKIGNQGYVCGGVLGGIVMKDDSGNDPKLDFINVKNTTCLNDGASTPRTGFWVAHSGDAWNTTTANQWFGFSVKYSCEAINTSLGSFPRTIAWTERFEGE